jgi:hypothetical protein
MFLKKGEQPNSEEFLWYGISQTDDGGGYNEIIIIRDPGTSKQLEKLVSDMS